MPKSLLEYAGWLAGRRMTWPQPPKPVAVKATPYLKPVAGIRAVSWGVYGTLLRIADGRLLPLVPQAIRMQVALEATIEEFNMWNSMTRKPGAPWEYMLSQYREIVEDQRMAGVRHKGDFPEVDSAAVWRKVLDRLGRKEYQYDEGELGDLDALSEKVAYFFHSRLQGIEAAPEALATLEQVRRGGFHQGILGDGQRFTTVQLLRALGSPDKLPALGDLFSPGGVVLSCHAGVRQPSRSLSRTAAEAWESLGVRPSQVLHVGCRLKDDLAVARQAGFRTALYAGDGTSLEASPDELRDPVLKPDRLITRISQVRDLLGI